jgi:hypothetical protein
MARRDGLDLENEYARAPLPDVRLERRLMRVATTLNRSPSASFPQAFPQPSELEAVYRLLNNSRVDLASILAPHFEATATKCREASSVIVAHDTTFFSFPGSQPIEGLGIVDARGRGFSGHFALAIDGSGEQLPLGVIGLETIIRTQYKDSERTANKRRRTADNEMLRWPRLARIVADRIRPVRAIHVADREGDYYDLLADLVAQHQGFVIRLAHDRRLATDDDHRLTVSDILWSVTPRQIRVLRAALGGSLPRTPTLKDCALGVANLGGYINRSRPPGSEE